MLTCQSIYLLHVSFTVGIVYAAFSCHVLDCIADVCVRCFPFGLSSVVSGVVDKQHTYIRERFCSFSQRGHCYFSPVEKIMVPSSCCGLCAFFRFSVRLCAVLTVLVACKPRGLAKYSPICLGDITSRPLSSSWSSFSFKTTMESGATTAPGRDPTAERHPQYKHARRLSPFGALPTEGWARTTRYGPQTRETTTATSLS